MPGQTLVVLADAHVGAATADVEESLLAFLDAMPELGDSLLINGDLFQFWFAYRRAIPRRAFPVAAQLAALARRVPVVIIGGNHDRWGQSFWSDQPGVRHDAHSLRFAAGGRRVHALHGDGIPPRRGLRPLLQRAVGHPITSAAYRWLHPDLGIPLALAAAPFLGGPPSNPTERAVRANAQRRWAEEAIRTDPSADLLIMAHTHAAAAVDVAPGRTYLNPGAWMDGRRYAVVSGSAVSLRQYEP